MTPANRRTVRFVWIAGVLVLCGLSFFFDAPVQKWVETHERPQLTELMNVVSRWGDWPSHVALGLLGAAVAYLTRRRRWLRIFLATVVACIVAGTVARVVKMSTGRTRPSVQTDVGWNGPSIHSKYHAFPSGHVAGSTAFFGVLVLAARRKAAPVLAIPALIGFSRIYVDAHHFSDVICAAALGFGCAILVWRVLRARSPSSTR